MDFSKLKKIEVSSIPMSKGGVSHNPVEALVKTKTKGYVPKGIEPRMRIASKIFSCVLNSEQMDLLHEDPMILSVSVGKEVVDKPEANGESSDLE